MLSKKYPGVDVKPFIDLVMIHGDLFSMVALQAAVSRDPDDDKFIATALSAKCKLIISGDKDLLDIDGYNGITVVKPSVFVKEHLLE